jgi:hypothetical protein
MRRSITILLCLTAVVVGCGKSSTSTGAGTVSADTWVSGMCTAISGWQHEAQQHASAFKPDTSSLENLKQSWLDFLDTNINDAKGLVGQLQALGTPDVNGGSEAASALTAEIQAIQGSFQDLRDQSANLPTTSATAFQTAFKPLLTDFETKVQTASSQIASSLSNPDLDKAFAAASACSSLQGGSTG